ncbi:Xanthine dehydrogenase [Micractinium conductrix]|uniref:xanthine dehydrogenase n=1 Tax=Micractinium conductrix TaxID=554055 RepID=A0A2P6VRE7_9CHLO|nr:Xanthine dehydrogenase [Micractinium conductrix]|eukprot:PSC76668.1 Xanthine dehydrogenase [Micractinium conductrix]
MGGSDGAEPIVYVNGKRHLLPSGAGHVTLLQYLRDLGLTGTKLGCGEGGCGACTVMVSSAETDGRLHHRAVNACLCPLYAVEGMHVVTVEGLGSTRDGLHPVQERLARAHGSQCGFCTPGFVMSMAALLRGMAPEAPTEEEIEEALAGNLCRCTGYRPILDAFKAFAKVDAAAYTEEAIAASKAAANGGANGSNGDAHGGGGATNGGAKSSNGKNGGGRVCPSTGRPCDCGVVDDSGGVTSTSAHKEESCGPLTHACPAVEPIFPPELRKRQPAELRIEGPQCTWYRPLTLDSLLAIKAEHPAAKLVVGNTEVGIEVKFKGLRYPVLIGATHVLEMNAIEADAEGLHIGGSVTLTKLMETCKGLIAKLPTHQTSTLRAVVEQLRWFAGPPIRNAAALGGNICTASPISDLNPLWMAAGATFTLVGQGSGQRSVAAKDFFLGYRKVDMQPHEVLLKVFVPFTQQYEFVKEFKQAHRRDDDIAIVNAGMRFRMAQAEDGGWQIAEASIAYGGVAPLTVMAPQTTAALQGRAIDGAALEAGLAAVQQDIQISANAPGGMVEFRRSLAASFLFKGLLFVAHQLEAEAPGYESPFPASYRSAVKPYERPPSHGLQYYSAVPGEDVVGQPYRHMAADQQVSGAAQYVDDIQLPAGALHAALVMSTKPHARILRLDTAAAAAMPGVHGVYTAKDIPGGNDIGPVLHDEELLATDEVLFVGQPIAIVAAETEAQARAAAAAVMVDYEDLPAILDIDDAIEASAFMEGWGHMVECGDVDAAFAQGCEMVLEGETKMGGQEHFYLEPNASIVIPGENDEYLSYSSTQCPDKHQKDICHVLGVPMHKVVVKTKRLGGGFGGKESRSGFINAACAIPAYHTRRPVRIVLDRDEDMQITGQRHAFMGRYKVGFTREGRLQALDLQLYCNAGFSLDLSAGVMDRALMHCDCTYRWGSLRAKGFVCKTNQASHTAFRGYGGPQGMVVAEQIIDRIAHEVGKPVEEIKALNMYQEGDLAPFGQALVGCQAQRCWDDVMASSGYAARNASVEVYNKEHRFRKRGVAVTPTKFGISFTTKFLNQAGALVHVYTDGTVLVTHGGVEMGQGLHTKVAQVVAHDLGIPLQDVYIAETATDKVPNASPTAASASSDMYGAAAADACAQLNGRLKPYYEKMPGKGFKEVVMAAYLDRTDLCAHGFYSTPDVTGFGGLYPFNYLCYGAAVSEVELDTLTGDFQVLRTDICMDVGKSLNPSIDIGQVEGGFVQGMGWSCIEELVWGDKQHAWVRPGQLFTRGPGTYKIPTANDIPVDFRVTLLRNAPCERTPMVHSSKAVGEPPFFLGTSVFFALKEACYAARADAGLTGWFRLDLPATPERLRLACADTLTRPYAAPDMLPKISC